MLPKYFQPIYYYSIRVISKSTKNIKCNFCFVSIFYVRLECCYVHSMQWTNLQFCILYIGIFLQEIRNALLYLRTCLHLTQRLLYKLSSNIVNVTFILKTISIRYAREYILLENVNII